MLAGMPVQMICINILGGLLILSSPHRATPFQSLVFEE